MQAFPAKYQAQLEAKSNQPIYVAEIIWADGGPGTEGTDEIYVGSVDVADIPGFPFPDRYLPYLHADSISSITEKFDERNGNSTIGTLKVSVLDKDQVFTKIIRRAEADTGQSIRRQRIELYMLFVGNTWADRVKVRTLNINGFSRDMKTESCQITAQSILARLRKKLFIAKTSLLAAAVAASGAVSVTLVDAIAFENKVVHSTFNAGSAVGFIKVNKEIMMWTSKAGNVLTVPPSGRAMLGTFAQAHEQNDDVSEVAVLKGNPFYIALALMTSGNGLINAFDVYPAHWGLGLHYEDTPLSHDIDYDQWALVGAAQSGYQSDLRESGIQREYVFTKPMEAKILIERHILVGSGAFGRMLGDGRYSCKALNRTPSAPIDMVTNSISASDVDVLLGPDDIVSLTGLTSKHSDVSASMLINYYPTPRDGKDFTRHAYFEDTASQARHGRDTRVAKYDVLGMLADSATVLNLFDTYNAVQSRYSSPPVSCKIEAMPQHHGIEVGDVVGIDYNVPDAMQDWFSWAKKLEAWQVNNPAATTFAVLEGERIVTANNQLYVAVASGTTMALEPFWGPATVSDGTVLWYLFDGHLSRAFEVVSTSLSIKTGRPVLDLFSQPEKSSFFNSSTGGAGATGYKFAEAAYQVGTELGSLPQFTVTGNATAGFTAMQNAPVTLHGNYYFTGDIVLNAAVTLTGNTRIYAASDGTVAVGTLTATNACIIDGAGNGFAGGFGGVPDSIVTTTNWLGTIINVSNGAGPGYVGRGGRGGSQKYVGGVLSSYGLGGAVSNSSSDTIKVIATGPEPFTNISSGLPATLNGSGGGSGGAIKFSGTSTGGTGGAGGAGLTIIARGIDIAASLIKLTGAPGVAGPLTGIAGSNSGGGGGGGSVALLVERNSTGTQTLLYEPSRIDLSGGGVAGNVGWYAGLSALAGGNGNIMAQVF